MEEKLIKYRRHFHKNPELGWLEYKTVAYIACELELLGFDIKKGEEILNSQSKLGLPNIEDNEKAWNEALKIYTRNQLQAFENNNTSVAATMDNGSEKTILFRFDIDALPINETFDEGHIPTLNGFRSENKGVMHSCGHDAHIAIGLGFANKIAQYKEKLNVNVIILFQPAEEGVRGAKSIVDSGFLNGVNYIMASHLWSNMPKGKIVCSQNGTMATNKLDVKIIGKSAHAGICPEKGIDAIKAAAQIINKLHELNKQINIGKIVGGTARNIIADSVSMEMELRAKEQKEEDFLYKIVISLIKDVAAKNSCEVHISKMGEASAVKGNGILAQLIFEEGEKIEQFTDIVLNDEENRGSEDFTSMMKYVKNIGGMACFIGIGAALNGKQLNHHTSNFDIDEGVMEPTVNLLFGVLQKIRRC